MRRSGVRSLVPFDPTEIVPSHGRTKEGGDCCEVDSPAQLKMTGGTSKATCAGYRVTYEVS